MRHLWRMTLWAAAAACALLIAVLAGRNEAGAERIASVFSSGHREARVAAAEHPFDAKAETRRLADAIHDLGAENAQLRTKLAEIEQNMNDITGSVTKQIAAVKAAATGPWPADAKPEPITAADIASIMAPAAGLETPAPSPPQTSPVSAPPAEPQASTDLPPIAPPSSKAARIRGRHGQRFVDLSAARALAWYPLRACTALCRFDANRDTARNSQNQAHRVASRGRPLGKFRGGGATLS